ncbi:MAG: NAD(P)/FAD-dependent oxidoreductase [Clostridia bacterium]|nr:NAD(P)/FAD-dependent oxidoreductase [Clostridia bacterium]
MKKILVAGAGIGGLVAAANLAKNGFDVTLLEKQNRDSIGHDWLDTMLKSAFEESGIPCPDSSVFSPQHNVCFHNPNKSMSLTAPENTDNSAAYIDRKFLSAYLIDYAEKCGAELRFGVNIRKAVTKNSRIVGVETDTEVIDCDLLIDSAGLDSPARKSLPDESGVRKELKESEIFSAYRAYYENITDETSEPRYNIYFFHCGNGGMDWVIKEKGFTDILVGNFTPLNEQKIKAATEDFFKDYPNMGRKIVRGGYCAQIPLRRTLPVIVWNGYAAVGDSAVMVEPMSGSGISLSMKAGKILADTVTKAVDYSKESLWNYQYRYFNELGNSQLSSDIMKNCLASMTAEDIDYLFEKKILTNAELAAQGATKYTVTEFLAKGVNLCLRPRLIMPFIRAFASIAKIGKTLKLMPEEYSKEQIDIWAKEYEKL